MAAVDLGASSGRVISCHWLGDRLLLEEMHRFANRAVRVGGTLHWDVLALYAETMHGLRAAAGSTELSAIGIDSWAVDYGLIDGSGALLGNPVHYRDARTAGAAARASASVPESELWAATGVASLPFTTLHQLVSAQGSGTLIGAHTLLLIPDLLAYWLTGQMGAEVTNASTTQLLDVTTRTWCLDIAQRVGIAGSLLPPLRASGVAVGPVLPAVAAEHGLIGGLQVIGVASHDTASAVVAMPAQGSDVAYISCGTWSLVGLELSRPVVTEQARSAGFSNEAGIDGTTRFLRNVMGLWLVQECLRIWQAVDPSCHLEPLLAQAAALPPGGPVIDADDPAFLPSGDMPARIHQACRTAGLPIPPGRAATVRCILDSLALAHRRALRDAQRLTGATVAVVHLIGGGSRNTLLCQLTADCCGVPVVAGPAEATAMGNALVQLRSVGADLPDREAMRAAVHRSTALHRYEPAGRGAAWDAADEALPGRGRRHTAADNRP